MTSGLNKVKAMLVAACDSCQQNNRDIAMNMLEIALDELQSMNPQDVEDSFQIVAVSDGEIGEGGIESACFNDEVEDEDYTNLDTLLDGEVANEEVAMTEDTAKQAFRDSVMRMFTPQLQA